MVARGGCGRRAVRQGWSNPQSELAPEDVGAQVRALRAQTISLQAQRARLLAEIEGKASIDWPGSLNGLTRGRSRRRTRRHEEPAGPVRRRLRPRCADEQAIDAQKVAGLGQGDRGQPMGQLALVVRQQALLEQQLQGVRSPAEKGATRPRIRSRDLERSAVDLQRAAAQHAAKYCRLSANRCRRPSCNLMIWRTSAASRRRRLCDRPKTS